MILAAVIITRLYSVFGSHGNQEKIRIMIKPLDKNIEKNLVENITQTIKENHNFAAQDIIIDTEHLSDLDKELIKIPNFNKEHFINGASRVFEAILNAFNSGNINNIKELISKKICDVFTQTIAYRQENKLTSEVDFICFDKVDIKSVKFLKNTVRIVVEFVSEQVNILKNDEGEIIEGDENFVQKITDIWTFERSINAKNNNWTLVSTKKNT